MRIWTVGHSIRPLADFLALLRHARIESLADVRRIPQSRRHPQFSREALARALNEAGVAYRHVEALGGHREPTPGERNAGLRNPAFRGYADYMGTAAFARALADLETLARSGRTAVMCAEADPRHCHRSLLADALTVRGWTVEHIVGGGERPPETVVHALHPAAHAARGRLTYPGHQRSLLGGDDRE